MSVTVSYIEPQQLAELLKTPEKQNTLIVDVRGEDFEGGHIKGALNIGEF
jgi:Cdc25 family phosphatase